MQHLCGCFDLGDVICLAKSELSVPRRDKHSLNSDDACVLTEGLHLFLDLFLSHAGNSFCEFIPFKNHLISIQAEGLLHRKVVHIDQFVHKEAALTDFLSSVSHLSSDAYDLSVQIILWRRLGLVRSHC